MRMPLLPDNAVPNDEGFTTAPSSRLQGALAAAEIGFDNAPLVRVGEWASLHSSVPVKTFTEPEWKESPFFRKDISFKDMANSQGVVSEQSAELHARLRDDRLLHEERLQAMPPGFLSGASRFIGSTIGFLGTPLNAAISVAAPEIIGAKAATLLSAITEASLPTRLAVKGALGALEGSAITLPEAVVDIATDKPLGIPVNAASALATVGIGAATGGLIRSVLGFRNIVNPESHQSAVETSIGQMAAGKSVDVEPILKQGYEAARREEGETPVSAVPKDELVKEVNKVKSTIDELESSVVEELNKTSSESISPDYIDDIKSDFEKPIDDRTIEDILETRKKILQLPDTDTLRPIRSKLLTNYDIYSLFKDGDEAFNGVSNMSGEPLTQEDVINYADKMRSYKSDSVYNEKNQSQFQERLDATPEDDSTNWESAKEDYEKTYGDTEKESWEEDTLDRIQQSDEAHSKFSSALRSILNCLVGST